MILTACVTLISCRDEDDDTNEELKLENDRLNRELESLRSKHSIELTRMKKAYEKTVHEYKETNAELQKEVGGSSSNRGSGLNLALVKIEKIDEEEEEEEDIFEDSLVGANRKKSKEASLPSKRKISKTKQPTQTQVK